LGYIDVVTKELRKQTVLHILRNEPILGKLAQEYKLKIVSSLQFKEYSKGQEVVSEYSKKGDKMIFVLEGRIRSGFSR